MSGWASGGGEGAGRAEREGRWWTDGESDVGDADAKGGQRGKREKWEAL